MMKRAVSVSLGSPSRDKKVVVDFNGVRSRITELTSKGYLKKAEKKKDSVTGKTVNAWELNMDIQVDLFGNGGINA